MKYSSKLLSISATVMLAASFFYGVGSSSNHLLKGNATQSEVALEEIIFQVQPGFDAKSYIHSIGGQVEQEIGMIDSIIAKVPVDRLNQVKVEVGLMNVSESNKIESC